MSEKTIAKHLKDIAFYLVSVSDMAGSRAFYTGVLGLKETANWNDKWVEYDLGHGTLALTTMSEEPEKGGGGAMIALEVSDLDGAFSTLKEMGVAVPDKPWASPACRGLQIKDPDGYAILLHETKGK
ncbi:VOC family protein [bacterium]|nr:MAG: VOC family protein [Verrucomicrobiota bacterium]RKZ07626.1 MAG: VOC family protein [bacterium]